ncbi:MAG TPA: peroxiredoxin [Candidatus Binataceae bacterium]|nr:peroxiredoxin [Candidatus Binataceae bacterium]
MPASIEERRPLDQAPAGGLELLNQLGEPVKLADFAGRVVALFFYPKDDTPGCTVEGKEFRDFHDEFAALDCAVIGVSVDPVESHRAFAEKHAFPFQLLADTDGRLAGAFGVLRDGKAERTTFVIGSSGRIRHTFREVSPRGHALQVLNFVRSLRQSKLMLGG